MESIRIPCVGIANGSRPKGSLTRSFPGSYFTYLNSWQLPQLSLHDNCRAFVRRSPYLPKSNNSVFLAFKASFMSRERFLFGHISTVPSMLHHLQWRDIVKFQIGSHLTSMAPIHGLHCLQCNDVLYHAQLHNHQSFCRSRVWFSQGITHHLKILIHQLSQSCIIRNAIIIFDCQSILSPTCSALTSMHIVLPHPWGLGVMAG